MDKTKLKQLFNQKYKQENWKDILLSLFPGSNLYLNVENIEISDTKKEIAKRVTVLGDLELNDKSRIQFYEVELQDDKKVTRNRVGLRNLIHSNVIPGNVDGIFATYFSEKSRDWRVSFISKSLYWDEEFNEIKSETHPKRYTYVLGDTETHKTAVERFSILLDKASTGIELQDLLKAFSVEKISKQFFDDYRAHFELFSEYLIKHNEFYKKFRGELKEETERNIRNFVKRLLGKIIFLYFVQKKGWLGVNPNNNWGTGSRNFIQELFNNFNSKNQFYSHCLVKLFYETLNIKRENDFIDFDCIPKCKVPYLNGGLFDRNLNDPLDVDFKPEMFESLFNFFDQYNFTIDENTPDDIDIGIDPEMLGMIFENLLEENKNRGTYYTPKEVVHYMCKESIALYLTQHLQHKLSKEEQYKVSEYIRNNIDDIPASVTNNANEIYNLVEKVKICDPAIGSGAFQLGMVFEILRIKRQLFGFTGKTRFDYKEEKLKVFKNSIYGVDLDPGAVDIARLRFWLSLVVDEDEPSTLPNLDYKIMQGDSLKENFEGIDLSKVVEGRAYEVTLVDGQMNWLDGTAKNAQTELHFSTEDSEGIKKLIDDYFNENDRDKKDKIHNKIDQIVLENIEYNLDIHKTALNRDKLVWKAKLDKKILNLSNKDQIEKLKSGSKEAKEIAKLEKAIAEVDKKYDHLKILQAKPERPYFLWHLFFNDTFEQSKGFDIVIGNPPYGVKVEDAVRKEYGVVSKDSYGVFMAMALEKLVKDDGVLCFIVSDTWLTIKSHKALRDKLLSKQLKKVIRLDKDCFNATVNSSIFTLIKNDSNENNLIAADLTNLSTRKNVPVFREKLFKLDDLVGEVNTTYAVYQYSQSLIFTNSSHPIFVASPKLFMLMNDTNCATETKIIGKNENYKEIQVRKIKFNDRETELVRFEDIADVKQGLATGDNEYYLYQNPEARGNYKNINAYKQYLLNEEDLNKIRDNEGVRLKVIQKGIHKTRNEEGFDEDLWFDGRYIVPHDKGGESDTLEGWLPNYFVKTNYFISFDNASVNRLKSLTIHQRNKLNGIPGGSDKICSRFQNIEYYFKSGIDYSQTGVYCPTFRINSSSIFNTESTSIFPLNIDFVYEYLAILCSKIIRFQVKNYIDSSVHASADKIKEIAFLWNTENQILKDLVNEIILKQKKNNKYNYFENEQKEIDRLVYELYGLNEEDINEVETWFARRYPRLAKYADIKSPQELLEIKEKNEEIHLIDQLIGAGESKKVEFKSSLRYCYRQKSAQDYIEHSVLKTITAFLNSDGGQLLIGVDDEGNKLGLENDFDTLKGHDKKDEFQKHFDNLLSKTFGDSVHSLINLEFYESDNKIICLINVPNRASQEVWLNNKSKNKEEFYIRRFASSIELTPREAIKYVREVWG
jgi:hypothetical protein